MEEDLNFEIQFLKGVYRRDPHDTSVIELLASLYNEAGRINDGLRMDRRLVRLEPDNPSAHYNLACSLALKERMPDAIRALRAAIDKGYREFDWLLEDPDLEELREHPNFHTLIEEFNIPC